MEKLWLLHGLLTELLGQAIGRAPWLAVLTGGVIFMLLAWLAAKDSRWAKPILYGLTGSASAIIIILGILSLSILSKSSSQTTLENIEPSIREWINTFNLANKKEPEQDSYFSYRVTVERGVQVAVRRTKARERYITMNTGLTIGVTDEDQKFQVLMNKLSGEQLSLVNNELILEMARLKILWDFGEVPLKNITLSKFIPITNSLTEDVFLTHLIEMANAVWVARASLIRAVAYASQHR
jgi:hypothetical protein